MNASVGSRFVLWAIQEWGQTDEKRIGAVQDILDAAGFKARATCWPIFGGIWPKPCEGQDGEQASAWLKQLTDTMQRGHFEDECAHVTQLIEARRKEKKA